MSRQPAVTESRTTGGEPVSSARTRPVDPLRSLAHQCRLRCYSDDCVDWNIPGRWGEIFWYGSARDGLQDRIGVQIGGPRANDSSARTTEKGGNFRINRLLQIWGKPSQRGNGEAVFVLPADRILEAAQAIGAKRRRTLSPEQRAAALKRLARFRQARTSPNSRPGPHVAGQERAKN